MNDDDVSRKGNHPDAAYFGVGKIGKYDVVDYAERKNIPLHRMEQWLAGSLGY